MQRTQHNREDEAAISKVIADMTDAFNKGDAKRLAELYAADGDLVNVYGTWLKGIDQISQGLRGMFSNIIKGATLKTVNVSIRFVSPEVAIGHVDNELSGQVGANGEKMSPQRELSLRVFVKEGDAWRVAAFHNTIKQTA